MQIILSERYTNTFNHTSINNSEINLLNTPDKSGANHGISKTFANIVTNN